MDFLKSTDSYAPKKALEMCGNAGLYKEQGLIYFKTGEIDQALKVLMTYCLDHVDEIINLCRLFDVPEDRIWDPLLSKARRDNSAIPQLLNNAESYRKPHRFIKAFNDKTLIKVMSHYHD